MGEVYKARDTRLGRIVAIKVLRPGAAADPERQRRFKQEARAVSALNHPHICILYDIGSQPSSISGQTVDYLVMEYLEGQTLAHRLQKGPLPLAEALRYGMEIADALDKAHRQGVIHRDLKPGNVMLTKSGAKLLDFGVAKLETPPDALTTLDRSSSTQEPIATPEQVAGTVPYMAPEQVEGKKTDARTDLFAFGAVLFEMITGQRAFGGESPATVLAVILRGDPPSMSSLQIVTPPALERVVRKCLAKDPDARWQSAGDLADELRWLASGPGTQDGAIPARTKAAPRPAWVWIGAAAALLLGAGILAWWGWARSRPKQTSVAVLPFQNIGSDKESDYLRLALPDEVATVLSYVPDLTIRPFAATQKYATEAIDPRRVGRELGVARIVTGHFAQEGSRIRVTVEAIDAGSNRLLWRDTWTSPSDDRINLQEQMVTRVGQRLTHSLTGSPVSIATATRPKNEEAYELYLRSIAFPNDGDENRQAIAMLERSIGLYSSYAPAWAEAARRYYNDFQYSVGGMPARRRAQVATERALSLDPNLLGARRRMIGLRVEAGQLDDAYEAARQLLQERPASGDAHFSVSYVLRYAGRLEDAGRECDTAFGLDPANATFRSCATTFEMLGRYDRAREFARLDAGSSFASWQIAFISLAEGRTQEAIPVLTRLENAGFAQASLILAYLRQDGPERIRSLSERSEQIVVNLADPEQAYVDARVQAFCRRPEAALRQLRRAVDGNYCAYPALDSDPLLDSVRKTPEFQAVRQSASSCHSGFGRAHGLQ